MHRTPHLVVFIVIGLAKFREGEARKRGLTFGYFDDFDCHELLRRQRDATAHGSWKGSSRIGVFTPVMCRKLQKWLKWNSGFRFVDCQDILKHENGKIKSGVYKIYPKGSRGFLVYCDMTTAGGGWTVIQHRQSARVNFYSDWKNYKYGFGDLNENFWLGNDKIHMLTSQGSYKIRFVLEDFKGSQRYAEYKVFAVADEKNKYKLTIGKYHGNAGDAMTYANGMQFSTKDFDTLKKCAALYKGGWWYRTCHFANLNGFYLKGKTKTHAVGMVWQQWLGYHYSLKKTTMMIRKN